MRLMRLTLVCGALFAFRSHPVESLAAPSPDVKTADIAKLPPPDQALAVIEGLQQPGLTDRQLDAGIASLGSFRTSPAAARALILWLNYYPEWCRRPSGPRKEWIAPGGRDSPAVRGLIAMGEFAAPFLVEADLQIFRKHRKSDILDLHPTRLGIHFVVHQNPKVCQKVVDCALQRIADAPQDVVLREACEAFIESILWQFTTAEREKLFPPNALQKFPPARRPPAPAESR